MEMKRDSFSHLRIEHFVLSIESSIDAKTNSLRQKTRQRQKLYPAKGALCGSRSSPVGGG